MMSRYRLVHGAMLLALLLATAPAWSITVKDDRNVDITLEAPAERVVALAPFITELVYSAGAGNRLVAVSEHSDYPPPARDLPRVGNAFSVNLERLLSMRPDVVFMWQSGNDPRVGERLEAMGLRVFVLEPRTPADVPRALRRIGRLLGTAEAAAEQARLFTRNMERVHHRYGDRPSVRVFYQVASSPLVTLNGRHMFSSILDVCGGVNVFRDLSPIAPTVNREQVMARDPEVILVSASGGEAEQLKRYWAGYPSITASRLGNIFPVDADLINRQTPRLVQGARQICNRLEQARKKLSRDALE